MSSVSHSLDIGQARTKFRGRVETQDPGGLTDALCRQAASRARREVHGAVVGTPCDTVGQQAGQMAVDGRVRLLKMSASSTDSMNGIRLRVSSNCSSERAMCRG